MELPNNCPELPKTLKKLREKNRFSQQQIAEILNISQSKYNYFESGKYCPDALSIKILAKLYNVTVTEFFDEQGAIAKSDSEHKMQPVVKLNESQEKDREKLIHVYEKRISELEEKCLRKNIKIEHLLSKLELQNNALAENGLKSF
jgi:transcriptional regulator with XRE-family HTH domain